MAVNVSGPRRYGLGTLRDYVIGISVVNDEGQEVKAGGRVVKNVAGYDLCKLYIGSLGTLGIISQVTLKLKPRPEEHALLTLGCDSDAFGPLLDALHRSRTRPVCVELLNGRRPRQRRSAACPSRPWVVVVGFEDNREAVSWQVQQLIKELAAGPGTAVTVLAEKSAQPLWSALVEFAAWPSARLTFKANLLSSAVAGFCREAADLPDGLLLQAHAGNGIVIGHAAGDLTAERAAAMLKGLLATATAARGNLIVTRCPPAWKPACPCGAPPRRRLARCAASRTPSTPAACSTPDALSFSRRPLGGAFRRAAQRAAAKRSCHSMATTTDPTRTSLPLAGAAQQGADIDYELFLDCVHCGLCTSACPTYVELGTEMDSPRGRIYLMRAVTDGRLAADDPEVRRHLDLCLDCRACESACPSGVQYGKLIEPFRIHLAKTQAPSISLECPAEVRPFRLTPYARRMRWALAPVRLMQKVGPRSPDREKRSARPDAALAAADARDGAAPEAASPVCRKCCRRRGSGGRRWPCSSAAPATPSCRRRRWPRRACSSGTAARCGCRGRRAAAGHCTTTPPRRSRRRRLPERIAEVSAEDAGGGRDHRQRRRLRGDAQGLRPLAARCRGTESFAAKVKDVSEFLMALGPVKPEHPLPMKATYHDACHLCHAQQIRRPPRQLLEMIPGLQLVPLNETEICCGAAGSYNITQPEMADRLGERKARNILATGARAVFTGNVGCLLQIGKHLRRQRPTCGWRTRSTPCGRVTAARFRRRQGGLS